TPDGMPYYDYSKLVARGTVAPGETTASRSLAFFNPKRVKFTYDLVFLAPLNRAPAFTSVPVVQVLASQRYTYNAAAADPDGDRLTFTLRAGPAGLAVDPVAGTVSWSPAAADVGTHAVCLRVEDGRGGFAEQKFVVSVVTGVPNRPPFFTSTPVVDAYVNT